MFISPRKRPQIPAHRLQKPAGFSLIEFMVASAISMIVLIAAGSTYFMTRQLNQVSGERLAAQQDLRNAATLIIRDARQAGTFGCANLADNSATAQVHVNSAYAATHPLGLRQNIDEHQPNGFGLRLMPGTAFIATNAANIADFTPQGNALIFVYGDGYASINDFTPRAPNPFVNATSLHTAATDANGSVSQALAATTGMAPIVVSSCSQMRVLRRDHEYTVVGNEIKLTSPMMVSNARSASSEFLAGQLSISKLVGSAYLIGRITGSNSNGLYRFHLSADGTWSGPQLLVSHIADTDGMGVQLGYVKSDTCIDGEPNPAETFTFRDATTNITNHSKLPALIRITLKVKSGSTRASGIDIGSVSDYVIDAAVRNGNVCANRGMGS